MKTLDDERREREANEASDPEEIFHQPPPEAPDEETVLEEGIPTSDVATVVIDEGGVPPPDTAVVVDMNPTRQGDGIDVVDISAPGTEVDASGRGGRKARRGDGTDGSSRGTGGAQMKAADADGERRAAGRSRSAKRRSGAGAQDAGAVIPSPAELPDLKNLLHRPAERLAQRVKLRDISRRRKIAYLLSQEVRRVVEELELRHRLLMEVWTRMRSRQPLLAVLRTRYEELPPADLLLLPVDCLEHLDRFYRILDEFRLYLMTTEEMPTALEQSYERFRLHLTQISRPLLWFLDETHRHEDALPARVPRAGEIIEG